MRNKNSNIKGRGEIILGLGASTLAGVVGSWNLSIQAREKNLSSEISLRDRAAAKGLIYGAFPEGNQRLINDIYKLNNEQYLRYQNQ